MLNRRSIENAARRLVADGPNDVPPALRSRWATIPTDLAQEEWGRRVSRFRIEVIPWLAGLHPLDGARVLEVGTGTGASTLCLVEQGADVVGMDVEPAQIEGGRRRLADLGLTADLRVLNATEVADVMHGRDWVIFWAVLEHMTITERLKSLRDAWRALPIGGLMTLVETPNRLWPIDSHTSRLPFFSWLPYELAYRYSHRSPREGYRELYTDDELSRMDHYLRRGYGVSFHEFDLALGSHADIPVSSMHIERRRQRPLRRVGWVLSDAGRTERVLRSYAPDTDRAWFQPFLYLTLRKTADHGRLVS